MVAKYLRGKLELKLFLLLHIDTKVHNTAMLPSSMKSLNRAYYRW